MFTIRPHFRSFMCGHTAWAQLKAPVRLTRRSRSHSSGCWSPNCPTWSSVPALLTRMSTEPSSSTARWTAAATCCRSVTSQRTARALRPIARISSAADSVCTSPCVRATMASGPYASVSSESSDSTSRSAITTSAPARASVRASARPSPREPPVTRATLPDRSISMLISAAGEKDLFGDDEALDLRGALVDLEQLRVAHQLLDRVLLHVPVAAEDLHRVGRDLHRRVRGEALRVGGLQRRPLALVEQPGGLPDEQPRRLDLGGHVGDEEVDALVHRDRLAELDTFARVLDRVLEGGPRDTDGARGRAGPRLV